MDGGGVTGIEEVSLALLLHSPIQESCPTQRARGRLESHRQNGFIRYFSFALFRGRVSSRQPLVTRAIRFQLRTIIVNKIPIEFI
jgi:hypothetical protein